MHPATSPHSLPSLLPPLLLLLFAFLPPSSHSAPAPPPSKFAVDPRDPSSWTFSPVTALQRAAASAAATSAAASPPAYLDPVLAAHEVAALRGKYAECSGSGGGMSSVDRGFCCFRMLSAAMVGARGLGLGPVVEELQRRSIACTFYDPRQVPCMLETVERLVDFYERYDVLRGEVIRADAGRVA